MERLMGRPGLEFAITRMAFDEQVRMILTLTSSRPMTVRLIAEGVSLPLDRAYHLVRTMSSLGMLRKVRLPNSYVNTYSANVKTIDFRIEQDCLGIVVVFEDGGRTSMEIGTSKAQVDALQVQ